MEIFLPELLEPKYLQDANLFHVHWNGSSESIKFFVHKYVCPFFFFQSHSSHSTKLKTFFYSRHVT